MKTQLTKKITQIVFFLAPYFLVAQQGIISGILNDDSGNPMPGASIVVKGTSTGVVTDFDGKYSITCNAGDILVFSFIGMNTREVEVTSSMFGETSNTVVVKKTPVKHIQSNAYKNALNQIKKNSVTKRSFEDSNKTYNKGSFFLFNRISNIETEKDNVKLTYFKPDTYYEIGFKNITSIQFVKNSNLPKLQNTYAQGISRNGSLEFHGPDTGNLFSYGPELNLLEFDGVNYAYDTNGKLVSIGSGNGSSAKTYNNSILNTSLKSVNNLFFNISTDYSSLGFDITNTTQKDAYNFETNRSNLITLHYKKTTYSNEELGWDTFIKYNVSTNNQPNINGFQNNLLLNNWITPISFQNSQGYELQNGEQRSFSPNNYNNPEWLLNNNRNAEKLTFFVASLKNTYSVSEDVTLRSKLNYNYNKNTQNFGLVKNTIGFENGYLSDRITYKNNFNTGLNFKFYKNYDKSNLTIISNSDYFYEDLNYSLFQANGFNNFTFNNASNSSFKNKSLNRNTLRLSNNISYRWERNTFKATLTNNSYVSSIQNNKWFLPTLQFKIDLDRLLHIYDFSELAITASTSFDVNDTPLLYNNQSHNSLNLSPEESLSYKAINDLFIDKSLKLEEKESYELGLDMRFNLFNTYWDFGANYYNTKTKNTVFPVIENNAFTLKNIAHIKNHGLEISLDTHIRIGSGFYCYPSITFSSYRTKVATLLDGQNSIPIAGFSTTSKNLIEGQPAGVIVGSAYARDNQNNLIIGADGFPLVSSEKKIIGNPIPDFNFGFSNDLKWKDFTFSFSIDFQKGGDIWNGTQNVLNYFGTSQQSASQRNISNYVYNGVTEQGNTNTTPVNFYNIDNDISENRFVRYGFEGVAEDAIVDGSYINLKSINLTYTIKKNHKNEFIRSLDVGVYANNLITWSKFNGASPYSSLYNNRSAKGLNLFNAPLMSEIGLSINLKI